MTGRARVVATFGVFHFIPAQCCHGPGAHFPDVVLGCLGILPHIVSMCKKFPIFDFIVYILQCDEDRRGPKSRT